MKKLQRSLVAVLLGVWTVSAIPCEVDKPAQEDPDHRFGWLMKLSGYCWSGQRWTDHRWPDHRWPAHPPTDRRWSGGSDLRAPSAQPAAVEVCYRLDAAVSALRIRARTPGNRTQDARIVSAGDGVLQLVADDAFGRTHGYTMYTPSSRGGAALAYRIPGGRPDGSTSTGGSDAGWEIRVEMTGNDRYDYRAHYSYGGVTRGFIEDRWTFTRGRECNESSC